MTNSQPDGAAALAVTMKDFNTENPRWCAGCGDFGIIAALKKFYVDRQMQPAGIVNISGIGCSSRSPHYINTYGVHSIHGRALTMALGVALTRPDMHLFVHSGDGDAMSIGGNHLIHAINKNFKCVFLMYDNELYGLTKHQTSPTTRKGHPTQTQPSGSYLDPLNPIMLAMGLGASFVASTADWLTDHMVSTINAAFDHPGFAFVHICQRCPHFDPLNFDSKMTDWFTFLDHPNGIKPDKRLIGRADTIQHDPTDVVKAFEYGAAERRYFGLYFQNKNKPRYDHVLQNLVANAPQKDRSKILEKFLI